MTSHAPRAPKGKPITGHRLFPALVSLWFCALFGLGSLAADPSFVGALILRSGVERFLPLAAPPLGFAARIAIVLAMAAVGAAIGAIVARSLRPAAPVTPRRVPDEVRAEPAKRRRYPVASSSTATMAQDEPAPPLMEAPQILDITGMDLGEPMAAPPEPGSDLAEQAAPAWDAAILDEPAAPVLTQTGPVVPRQVFGMANEELDPAVADPFVDRQADDEMPMPNEAPPAGNVHWPAPLEPQNIRRLFPTRANGVDAVAAPPLAGPMPAALRPIALDAADEDADHDEALLQSLLPPRRQPLSAGAGTTAPATRASTDEADEDKYGSLLDIGSGGLPRLAAETVEEPEDFGEAFEPAVIFPRHAAPAAPAATAQENPLGEARVRAEPDETEQALRAALANLQRISSVG